MKTLAYTGLIIGACWVALIAHYVWVISRTHPAWSTLRNPAQSMHHTIR